MLDEYGVAKRSKQVESVQKGYYEEKNVYQNNDFIQISSALVVLSFLIVFC